MICGFFCVFFCGMNCGFFCAFFVVWIVFFFVLFFVVWIVVFFVLFFVVWIVFFCAFFVVWIVVFFVLFFVVWIVVFFVLFFVVWIVVFFVLFFVVWIVFFFCAFFVVWIVFFSVLFFVLGSAGKAPKKAQKSTKKARKKHNFFGKMNLRPPGLDSLRTSGPANVSHHFLFSNLLSKKNSQEWAHARSGKPGAGMWKKCNYHMMFIKNLNNYCWRDAFVTLFTYNLQWLDRLIAVSRYLRYAAFNIVKNVMSHNIISSYRCNTLHHHTISLPLLFDTQIFR